MPKAKRFTRIPLPAEFMDVPRECIGTYTVLASYAANDTGLCWPKMETLAKTLRCSVRTVQRHLQALRAAGLIEYVERRRWRGRYSSYLYRMVHYTSFTTGHRRRVGSRFPNKSRTKPPTNPPKQPKTREEEAARRRDGYEWLFR